MIKISFFENYEEEYMEISAWGVQTGNHQSQVSHWSFLLKSVIFHELFSFRLINDFYEDLAINGFIHIRWEKVGPND